MHFVLTTLTATTTTLLLLLLGLLSAHGLPTASRSGLAARLEAGEDLAQLLAGPSPAKTLTKRDLSINRDLQSLADMLLARERSRIQSNNRNRAFLRELGKRADVFDLGEESDEGLAPTLLEPSEEWLNNRW